MGFDEATLDAMLGTHCPNMLYPYARQTISDLIQSGGPFNGGATWGPYVDYLQTQKNAEMLLESIKMSVDPNAWSDRGGPSSILFHYPTMSIVVRAPSEVQYSLGLAMYGKKK